MPSSRVRNNSIWPDSTTYTRSPRSPCLNASLLVVELDRLRVAGPSVGAGREVDDLVGQRDEALVVRGDDDEVTVVGELANELQHTVDLDVVEVRGRFVGEQHGRIVRERTRDRDALLLTARHVGGAVVHAVFEIDLLQQRDRAVRAPRGASRPRRATAP